MSSAGESRVNNNNNGKPTKDDVLQTIEREMANYMTRIKGAPKNVAAHQKRMHRHTQHLHETIVNNYNKLSNANRAKLASKIHGRSWTPVRWIGEFFPNSKYSRRSGK
jgi:N-glycosylase/DNA lyase